MHSPCRQPAFHPAQTGSTLVEVLAALSILAIGVIGLASAQGRSLAVSQLTHEHLLAHSLALSVIEQLRASPQAPLQGPRLSEWQERAAQSLPQGELSLESRHGGRGGQIVIQWSDSLGGPEAPQVLRRDFYR